MLRKLQKLDFRHIHQCVDFVFRALEILNGERVDGNDFHAGLVADFQYLRKTSAHLSWFFSWFTSPSYPRKGLKPQIMPFYCLYAMTPCKSAVSIHHKGDMPWDRTLP